MNSLYRSSDEKVVAGVCAGLAHRFDLNKTGLRWAFAIASFFVWVPVIVYVAFWIVLKERSTLGVIEVR